jgi:hypothetical protein
MQSIADCPKIIEFLEERGLCPDHAAAVGVRGLDALRIAYPLWNGQWKWRHVLTKEMGVAKMGIDEKPLPAVFGDFAQGVGLRSDFHIHLTEGETDALALSQVLHHESLSGVAVAVPGVNGMTHAVRLLRPLLGENVHLTIYPDPDEAGLSLAAAASELGAHVVSLPPNKDLCSYLGGMDSVHRWPALQLLRHHAATYIPYTPSQRPSKETRHVKGSNVPDGVRSYFQRIVASQVGDEHIGYSEVEKVCCPWHEDPNPSLSIDWVRCIWFCHGCQLGGGVKRWRELIDRSTM